MKLIIVSKKVRFLLKETFRGSIDDNILQLSAALSYYTIFSLPPLLIIFISMSGIFFDTESVKGVIFGQISGLAGKNAAMQIIDIIQNIKFLNSNTFATILSLVILFIGASGVFAEIQDSVNYIWGIKTKPRHGFVKFIYNRLVSFSMIGSVVFLLLVGLIANSLIAFLSSRLSLYFPLDAFIVMMLINTLIGFVIITLLFSVIFKSLPDGKIAFGDCIIGASFTAFLFMIGKFAISQYLGHYGIISVYGAAGSVILILAWVYYSAIILYFGAEFTNVYATYYGKKIVPNEYSFQSKISV